MDFNFNSTAQQMQLATQQLNSGQYALSISGFEAVIAEFPEHADALNLLGVSYDVSGQSDRAIVCLKKATEIRPEHAESWNNLGLAYQSKRDAENAEGAFRCALFKQPEYVEAAFNLARTLLSVGKVQESENWAKRVVQSASGVPEAHALMGQIKLELQDLPAATQSFEKAVELGYARDDVKATLKELHRIAQNSAPV